MAIVGAVHNGMPDELVNGTFDRVPGERKPGGAPVYRKRGDGGKLWLFLAPSVNMWHVGGTERKDARKAMGWASTVNAVAAGTLPHEAPAGKWKVGIPGGYGMAPQPAITVTAV